MKITDMMMLDIRAEIEFKEETIVIKNPKGDIRVKLLEKLNDKLMNESGLEDIQLDDLELIEILMKELTNIEISDQDDVRSILMCPCEELTRVSFHLASILQELMFEVIATKNLELRNNEFLVLQDDTMYTLNRIENTIGEVKQRSYMRVLQDDNEEDYNYEPKTNVITDTVTKDEDVVQLHGKEDGKNI